MKPNENYFNINKNLEINKQLFLKVYNLLFKFLENSVNYNKIYLIDKTMNVHLIFEKNHFDENNINNINNINNVDNICCIDMVGLKILGLV